MEIQEKLNKAVKIAQDYIILFLKDYVNHEQLESIKSLFENCPVVAEKIEHRTNEFGKIDCIGGLAEKDKIIIDARKVKTFSLDNELELNQVLGTIIHEYAHEIRGLNNKYGEMFEESFASIFAEICINSARLKLGTTNKETFNTLDFVEYQRAQSQIRALLYVLKQKNLDLKLIAEYVAGNQDKFREECKNILGNAFDNYFNLMSSRDNKGAEEVVIDLISDYIKQNGLSIREYWETNNIALNSDNLYLKGSATLAKAVVKSGSESFIPEEQEYFKNFEYSAKIALEDENLLKQEKVDRIRKFIETKLSLKGKTIEEMYDSIIDLCSTYIQHKERNDEESKIYKEEIVRLMPEIENFKTKFITLRVADKDKQIFDDLDLDNITYNDILLNMDKLLANDRENNSNKL